MLLGDPMYEHLLQGQLACLLLLLLTLAWVASRSGRPATAGACLALATAIKLFPALLFFYYLLRKEWRVVWSGVAWLLAITAATAALLGPAAYADYFTGVLPQLSGLRINCLNLSLAGFWAKIFVSSPAWTWAVTLMSSGLVLAVLGWAIVRADSRRGQDGAFGLTLITMLLLSPISWNHYAPLLFLPLLWLWLELTPQSTGRGIFGVALALLWLSPFTIWTFFGASPRLNLTPRSYGDSLTAFSIQLYALLALFALGVTTLLRLSARKAEPPRCTEEESELSQQDEPIAQAA
jgi:hypothetical protein